jgi:hypothetical protein
VTKQEINVLNVCIVLGGASRYEVRADPDKNASLNQCRFVASGTGLPDAPLLRELLEKVLSAYGASQSPRVCVDANKFIKPDANCP